MIDLSFVDLQFLNLGIRKNWRFDEKDIEQSDLKKFGVGRILDQLASLKERKLIDVNQNGSFSITSTARHLLWDDKIPARIRILKILKIKPQSIEKISSFLQISQDIVQTEIEELRKQQLVLMSPLRTEFGIKKMYEILPDGIEQIEKSQILQSQNKQEMSNPDIDIKSIIEETVEKIKELNGISEGEKNEIILKILQIKEKLKI